MQTSTFKARCLRRLLLATLIVLPGSLTAQDEEIGGKEGYTAPFREINLAASEPGLMAALDVEEGDTVKTGQVIARLDHRVLKASLAMARRQMEAVGQLRSAESEFKLRDERWNKLVMLQQRQHASAEEVALAKTERDVAESRIISVREDLDVKKLDYERIKAQLEQRLVRAPFSGMVTKISREVGEYVPATDPAVMTVVQLNPLLATFSLLPSDTTDLKKGKRVKILFYGNDKSADGTVSFVSPVNDAESGLVRVKVEIPNPDYALRSGAKCTLSTDGSTDSTRITSKPKKRPAVYPKTSSKGIQINPERR